MWLLRFRSVVKLSRFFLFLILWALSSSYISSFCVVLFGALLIKFDMFGRYFNSCLLKMNYVSFGLIEICCTYASVCSYIFLATSIYDLLKLLVFLSLNLHRVIWIICAEKNIYIYTFCNIVRNIFFPVYLFIFSVSQTFLFIILTQKVSFNTIKV